MSESFESEAFPELRSEPDRLLALGCELELLDDEEPRAEEELRDGLELLAEEELRDGEALRAEDVSLDGGEELLVWGFSAVELRAGGFETLGPVAVEPWLRRVLLSVRARRGSSVGTCRVRLVLLRDAGAVRLFVELFVAGSLVLPTPGDRDSFLSVAGRF